MNFSQKRTTENWYENIDWMVFLAISFSFNCTGRSASCFDCLLDRKTRNYVLTSWYILKILFECIFYSFFYWNPCTCTCIKISTISMFHRRKSSQSVFFLFPMLLQSYLCHKYLTKQLKKKTKHAFFYTKCLVYSDLVYCSYMGNCRSSNWFFFFKAF